MDHYRPFSLSFLSCFSVMSGCFPLSLFLVLKTSEIHLHLETGKVRFLQSTRRYFNPRIISNEHWGLDYPLVHLFNHPLVCVLFGHLFSFTRSVFRDSDRFVPTLKVDINLRLHLVTPSGSQIHPAHMISIYMILSYFVSSRWNPFRTLCSPKWRTF